jgi:hypothetical protein
LLSQKLCSGELNTEKSESVFSALLNPFSSKIQLIIVREFVVFLDFYEAIPTLNFVFQSNGIGIRYPIPE